MLMTKYLLTMTEEQARCVVAALDLSMRIRLGQWNEIVWSCMELEPDADVDEWCKRRNEAEKILLDARKIVMPELTGAGHSYGVYQMHETERAFNLLKAVRSCLAYHENPEGGITVNFDRPRAVNVEEEMPKCEVVEE